MMSQRTRERIQTRLVFLYGSEKGQQCYERLASHLDEFKQQIVPRPVSESRGLSERDVVLITYGDLLRDADTPPLATLNNFLNKHLKDVISTVHLLPFFPYSSDDGFSVIDYRAVSPELGTWDDISGLRQNFKLVVDSVINHVSAESSWFQGFLRCDERYKDYFITVDPNVDLSMVVRPRALPLLTPVQTAGGERHVWTTFSPDQIDLNYANPDVLLAVVEVLLFYIKNGADVIRLDAIAYLWKEVGTPSIHLPQTHTIVQLLRSIIDEVAPWVSLITETNVPHEENVSYFGDGTNEAHLVYQFPLPPLVAHAFLTGNASRLSEWVGGLETPSPQTAFFNFTASHDGVGIRPAAGILSEAEIALLIARAQANGGDVSFKANADGSASPYELNITYFDLLNSPEDKEPQSLQVQKFLASQAIMLALAGVPGIYFHNLLGSRNYQAGVRETGHLRAINREKLDLAEVEAELRDTKSLRHEVFSGYKSLVHKRIQERAFHPNGGQQVFAVNEAVFALLRTAPTGDEAILALHNVSAEPQTVTVNPVDLGLEMISMLTDIITGKPFAVLQSESLMIELEAYQVAWLKSKSE